MLSKFARTSARSVRTSFNAGAKTMAVRNMSATLDGYGDHLFKGAVAAPYLTKHGLAANALDTHAWTTDGSKDKVFGDIPSFGR